MDVGQFEMLLRSRAAQEAAACPAQALRPTLGADAAVQYNTLLTNRRAKMALRLDEVSGRARLWQARGRRCAPPPLAAVIARAAKQLRRRERAQAAWQKLVAGRWAVVSRVERVAGRGGTDVIVRVSSSTVLYELRRRHAELHRELARLVPGVRRLRFVVRAVSGGVRGGPE